MNLTGGPQTTLLVARANATPPSQSEGSNNLISTDLAGNVRVVQTSTQTVAGTTTANQGTPAAGTNAWPVVVFSGNSSIGTVSLAATNATASIGTVTPGVSSAVVSLYTIQLAATNVTGSIGTITLGAAPGTTSLGTLTNGPAAASIGTVFVAGLQASGAAVAGNPLLGGGRAATTLPTAVADGQAVARQLDQYGRTVVECAPQALWGQGRVTLTTTTASAILATAGASTKWAIRTICASSTQTATSTRLDVFDGSTAALIHSLWFPAGIGNQDGGPDFIQLDPPWVASVNTQVLVKLSVAVTDVRVLVTAFKVL